MMNSYSLTDPLENRMRFQNCVFFMGVDSTRYKHTIFETTTTQRVNEKINSRSLIPSARVEVNNGTV